MLSHLDAQGKAAMVDVTTKDISQRHAIAEGYVYMNSQALALIASGRHHKGDVFAVARIAGIQGAKQTATLVPLCHPLLLSHIAIELTLESDLGRVRIESQCKLAGQTGVEMEALTAVSVTALTLFDMIKAVDPAMRIDGIRVLEKHGGKTGHWQAP